MATLTQTSLRETLAVMTVDEWAGNKTSIVSHLRPHTLSFDVSRRTRCRLQLRSALH